MAKHILTAVFSASGVTGKVGRAISETFDIDFYHFGKSTTPDRPDQTWVNCLNLFVAGYTV